MDELDKDDEEELVEMLLLDRLLPDELRLDELDELDSEDALDTDSDRLDRLDDTELLEIDELEEDKLDDDKLLELLDWLLTELLEDWLDSSFSSKCAGTSGQIG